MRRPLHLVTTERHVEQCLSRGEMARSRRFWVRKMARGELHPAAAEVTRLATARAAAELGERLGREPSASLIASLDAALGELRRAGVGPADFENARSRRAALLSQLLERSDRRLAAAGFFDERATGWLAQRMIGVAADDDWPSEIAVEGLFDWDPGTLAWVEALAARVPVTVRMARLLHGPAELVNAPEIILSQLEARWHDLEAAPDLELVPVSLPADIRLIEGAHDGAEARAIARTVADALARGTAPDAIAILLPTFDEVFLEPLRAALEEAEIAFEEPRGRPPTAPPAPRAALAWLRLAAAPLERDALIDLLKTRAVDPRLFIGQPDAPKNRERALSLARRLSRLPLRADHDGKLLLDLLRAEIADRPGDRWMPDAVARIVQARDALRGPAPRKALLAELVATWSALGLLDAGERGIAAFASAPASEPDARILGRLLFEQAAGMRALLDAGERVERAAAALGDAAEPVSIITLEAELEAALAGAVPATTHRPGAVRLARASELAGIDTELLVLARASEGSFEASSFAHPLLDESLLALLPAARRPLSPGMRLATYRTELLAAMAASSKMVLTRSSTDEDGRALPPSALFAELAKGHRVDKEAAIPSGGSALLSSRMGEIVALQHGARPVDPEVERRVAIEIARQAFFLDPRKPATPETGAIAAGDPVVRRQLERAFGGTEDRPIAATAIERAALCRFAVFATKVLGASVTEAIAEELEPTQRGSLVHRALKLALETIQSLRPRSMSRAGLLAAVDAAVRGSLALGKSSPLYRAEIERALRDVTAVVEWSLDDPSGFEFQFAERSFGQTPEGHARTPGWSAFVARGQNAKVFIRGRIDRIDGSRDGSRVRIVDYKTGSLPAWKDVGTLLFQPPIYAYAVLGQMGRLAVTELRALYLDTSKRPPRPLPVGQGQVLDIERLEAAQKKAADLVARLWSGDVAPRPVDAAVCSRCDVRPVCRRPAAMPVEEVDPETDETGAVPWGSS